MSKNSSKKVSPENSQPATASKRRPKRQALGRGLGAMLARTEQQASEDIASLRELSLDRIQPGRYQPRSVMDPDKLKELADSIRSQGVVQPVIVRPLNNTDADAGYELIAGERRWRAAQLAGLRAIPAVIRQVSDEMTIAMALIENIQREDLNPLEEASALQRLIDEFSMTHQAAAEAVGRSRAAVSNLLRLRDLPGSVQQLLETRQLDMGHARALLALPAAGQLAAAKKVVQLGLSVRATENMVRNLLAAGGSDKAARSKPKSDPNIVRLEQQLSDQIGAPVSIAQSGKGRGELRIRYNSLDELEGILEHLRRD